MSQCQPGKADTVLQTVHLAWKMAFRLQRMMVSWMTNSLMGLILAATLFSWCST